MEDRIIHVGAIRLYCLEAAMTEGWEREGFRPRFKRPWVLKRLFLYSARLSCEFFVGDPLSNNLPHCEVESVSIV
jgi:hypothetical protein